MNTDTSMLLRNCAIRYSDLNDEHVLQLRDACWALRDRCETEHRLLDIELAARSVEHSVVPHPSEMLQDHVDECSAGFLETGKLT